MKRYFQIAAWIFVISIVAALPSVLDAAVYNASSGITAIASIGGATYIRFMGLPNPGACGINNGWVVIPSDAPDSMKSLAISLYFSGKPVRVDTSGCAGSYENVTALYSPGG